LNVRSSCQKKAVKTVAGSKKEEFAGLTHMVPGNSFPQICVVSETIMGNIPKRHKGTKVLE